jgi:hypothetical protein
MAEGIGQQETPFAFLEPGTALDEIRQGWDKRAYGRGLDSFRSNVEHA